MATFHDTDLDPADLDDMRAERFAVTCTCGGNPDVDCYACSNDYAAACEWEEEEAEWDVAEVRAAEELEAEADNGPWPLFREAA